MRRLFLAVLPVCVALAACSDPTGTDASREVPTSVSLPPQTSYAFSGLGGLSSSAFPQAVNDRSLVVGWISNGSGGTQAFAWRDGSYVALPGLGGPTSGAQDVNDRGDVVGHADNAAGYPRAVLWRNGGVTDLGTLGGDFSFATGVNARGEVVGASETATGAVHAFLWSRGRMRDLGALSGAASSRAEDVNDRGIVVGWSSGGGVVQEATLWRNNRIDDLGTLGNESAAVAIDDRGHIVGGSIPLTQTEALAVMWTEDGIRSLGTLGGGFSNAASINNAGQVVGASRNASGVQAAFVWQRESMVELPGTAGGAPSAAFDINGRGLIVGYSAGPVLWEKSASRSGYGGDLVAGASVLELGRLTGPGAARWARGVCATRGRLGTPRLAVEVAAGC